MQKNKKTLEKAVTFVLELSLRAKRQVQKTYHIILFALINSLFSYRPCLRKLETIRINRVQMRCLGLS